MESCSIYPFVTDFFSLVYCLQHSSMFVACDRIFFKNHCVRDFSGSPVVKTPCFQCKVFEFYPWSGNWDRRAAWPRRTKKKLTQITLVLALYLTVIQISKVHCTLTCN